MIQQWFANRREATLQIRVLRKWIKSKIEKRKTKTEKIQMVHKDNHKVQFKKDVDSYIVDFDAQTFTCDEF